MSSKQFFAQIAVFTLLGVNIAAYYFFWPSHGGWSSGEGKILAPENSVSKGSGEAPAEKIPAPRTFDPVAASSPPPGFLEMRELLASQKGQDETDPVNELLKEIQKQAIGAPPAIVAPPLSPPSEALASLDRKPVDELVIEIQKQPIGTPSVIVAPPLSPPSGAFPSFNIKNGDNLPPVPAPMNDVKTGTINQTLQFPEGPARPGDRVTLPLTDLPERKMANSVAPPALPPIKAEPLRLPAPGEGVQSVGNTQGLIPVALSVDPALKQQQSPWLLHTELVGTRTRAIARLPQKGLPPVEFNILCDSVEKTQSAIQMAGKVTFVGGGLKGSCQQLTLPLNEAKIIFAENVEIAPDAATPAAFGAGEKQSGLLRCERMTWVPPTSVRAAGPMTDEVRPAIFNPMSPPPVPNESRIFTFPR